MSRAYGPVATPHVFIFDRARKLRFVGRIDNSDKLRWSTSHETRDAIEALLAGKPVPVEKTKAFGCSIKWSDKRASAKKSLDAWAKEEVELKLIDEKGIKALVQNDGKNLRLIERLGHVVRSLRGRASRVRDHQPHVPQSGFRADHHLGRFARRKRQGPGGAQEETGGRHELSVRGQRQVQVDGRRGPDNRRAPCRTRSWSRREERSSIATATRAIRWKSRRPSSTTWGEPTSRPAAATDDVRPLLANRLSGRQDFPPPSGLRRRYPASTSCQ